MRLRSSPFSKVNLKTRLIHHQNDGQFISSYVRSSFNLTCATDANLKWELDLISFQNTDGSIAYCAQINANHVNGFEIKAKVTFKFHGLSGNNVYLLLFQTMSATFETSASADSPLEFRYDLDPSQELIDQVEVECTIEY